MKIDYDPSNQEIILESTNDGEIFQLGQLKAKFGVRAVSGFMHDGRVCCRLKVSIQNLIELLLLDL